MGIDRWERRYETMLWDENGEYVLFADHEQVVRDAWNRVGEAQLQRDQFWDEVQSLREILSERADETDRLRAELAAKSKDAERLHRAIGIVCEGFTLPDDVRKILEKALWSDAAMGEGNAQDA